MSKTARPARTSTARKRTSVKPATKRAPAKRAPAKRAPAKRAPAKRAPAKRAQAKRAPAKRAPAKRAPAKRTKTIAKAPGNRQAARAATPPAPERRAAKPRLPADVKVAVAAARDKLAIDLTVLDLRDATAFTDFFIICTGTNVRQVQAIADAIEASLRAEGQKPALIEGYRRGEWVLLDYFSFIVHVFLPARRTFYALERLWGGAEPIEVSAP